MSPRHKTWLKGLLVAPPILAGVAFLALQISGRPPPEQAEPAESARSVRVIAVQAVDYVPRALGFGYVEPGKAWEAVAQVAGRIVYRHPELERGRVIEADTPILRIDPTDSELAVARIESNLESVAARLEELEIREANTKRLLEIERRALALARQDLERKEALLSRGNASQASVDQAENAVLVQRQKIQDLENQLKLVPAERGVLAADRDLQRAQLREAQLNLERTEIRLPFAARIAEVTVEIQQYAAVGQRLAVADSVDVAEVSAQVAIDQVRPLVPPGFEIGALTPSDLSVGPKRWGLSAKVRLRSGDLAASWDARFDRISDTIDPQTRTLGFIVAVDDPYGQIIPGERPPLVKNMYVEVELRSAPRHGQIVVPRVAINRDARGVPVVHLVDDDDRLRIRSVELGPAQGNFTVVEAGLSEGERVVVSDLIPAIEGMLLAPNPDEALARQLAAEAAGERELR